MLSQLILEQAVPANHEAIITSDRSISWSQLREQVHSMLHVEKTLGRRRVGLSCGPTSESYAALAALDKLASDVFLFDARLLMDDRLRLAEKLRLGAVVSPGRNGDAPVLELHELPNEERGSGSSTVTILTSGTTGEPKAATHSWDSLCRPIRRSTKHPAPRWLLTYRPNLYAGLQVMLQCFADRGSLVLPNAEMDPHSVAELMRAAGVQFVSATPSFWRRLLMFSDTCTLQKIPLAQITLGGEVVDQPVLDQLRKIFPRARLVHIYATTELGRCFSVSDGLAGFPVGYLSDVLPDGVRLRVDGGELLVQSPNSMRAYDRCSSGQHGSGDWFHTGDLVHVKGDRVYFAGRESDLINVAGNKVHPIEVERVIRVIPGVSDVRVFGRASSIAGEIVACEILPQPDQDPKVLKDTVIRLCRSQLASYQQPRLIKLVDRLDLSSAGKIVRTKTS